MEEGFLGTDDSMLVERIGVPVKVVEGSYSNIKITTPEDLDYADFIRQKKRNGERLT
ncbi:2-C-methyl-D-erythritol 4-phosphate cytidylyltransferase [compost metagenome]